MKMDIDSDTPLWQLTHEQSRHLRDDIGKAVVEHQVEHSQLTSYSPAPDGHDTERASVPHRWQRIRHIQIVIVAFGSNNNKATARDLWNSVTTVTGQRQRFEWETLYLTRWS